MSLKRTFGFATRDQLAVADEEAASSAAVIEALMAPKEASLALSTSL